MLTLRVERLLLNSSGMHFEISCITGKACNHRQHSKTVAEYYKIKVADILSKRRTRSVARPRQMAMALAKELTNHSFLRSVIRLAVEIIRLCYTRAVR